MKILLISPMAYAIKPANLHYAGIERLVWEYAEELARNPVNKVTISAPVETILPANVTNICGETAGYEQQKEVSAFTSTSHLLRTFDVIHDFSHLHLAARNIPNLPTLNIFWHSPTLAKYPKAPYNIIALSKWAVGAFQQVYKQRAIYQQSIVINPTRFFVNGYTPTDRLLTLGRMGEDKGNLDAILFAKKYDLGLYVAGGRGSDIDNAPLTEYEQQIKSSCDDKRIFYGDVDESTKVKLMQTCKALIYITTHPEVTSHKTMEALACGCPAIVPDIAAMPELVPASVGFRCRSEADYKHAVDEVDKIDRSACAKWASQWYTAKVVADYMPLYEAVAGGMRWK